MQKRQPDNNPYRHGDERSRVPDRQQGQGDRYGRSGKAPDQFSFRTADFLTPAQASNAQYEEFEQTYKSAALAAQQLAPQLAPDNPGYPQWQVPVNPGAAFDYGHGNPATQSYPPFQSSAPGTSMGSRGGAGYSSDSSRQDREKSESRDARGSSYGKSGSGRDYGYAYGNYEDDYEYDSKARFSKGQLEAAAIKVINDLADDRELVTTQAIEKKLLEYFKKKSLRDLGIRHLDDINYISEHIRTQYQVSCCIQAYVTVCNVATYCDLKDCLRELVPDDGGFEDLNLGPLKKQPLVYKYFKVPQKVKIPVITALDVWMHLRDYVTKKDLWNSLVDLQDFMEYLQKEYEVENPYHLGVRMKSMPLAMQMLKKAQRDQGKAIKNAFIRFKGELANDVLQAFQNYRTKIFQRNTETGFEIKEHYLSASVPEVTGGIFNRLQILFNAVLHQQKAKWKDLRKMTDIVTAFSSKLAEDRLLASLFQLAVSVSNHDFQENLVKEIFPSARGSGTGNDGEGSGGGGGGGGGEKVEKKTPPPLDTLLSQLEKYVERCLAHGALTLEQMGKVEEKICTDFGFPHFGLMGFGNFLRFCTGQQEALDMFEDLGANFSLAGGGSGGTWYHPSIHDVVDLVQQCNVKEKSETDVLESALCSHYRVDNIKSLGFGPIKCIQLSMERQQKHQHREQTILYESAICCNASLVQQAGQAEDRQVGLLGHQTKEMALTLLQSCPLLENMEEWSHWSLVFQPQLGKLKTFVQKHGGIQTTHYTGTGLISSDILAFETEPGVLLKITAKTSIDDFLEGAKTGDVNKACGHLASLIVMNKGTKNTPLSLLGNNMVTGLFEIHNAETKTKKGGSDTSQISKSAEVQFVRDCLLKLPLRICQLVASQIFLEPLSQVVGASRSKSALLESCITIEQRGRIELLGMLLGVGEWSQAFQNRMKTSHDEVIKISKAEQKELEAYIPKGEGDDDEPESEESSDEENDNEMDAHILSDMEVEEEDETSTETRASKRGKKKIEMVEDKRDGLTSKERKCKEVVDTIRKQEFGIGIKLNDEASRLLTIQQERLGRSLDRLSKDLYSKDTHFVLELIQNADDNAYPDDFFRPKSKMTPSIQFIVGEGAITVMNNECGFEEKNVRAVCDVGKSTKGKHKFGYIGQKGIGFKSIFRVTDRPEIHSNGYHICFDVKSGPMGFILPHWNPETVESDIKTWTTKIILPLKESMIGDGSSQALGNRFHDIHPSLLLFLHRLRNITVLNKVDGTTLKMSRKDIGKNVIEIKHNNGLDRWLVMKKLLDASKISKEAKSGAEVESTEIALAFPLAQLKDERTKVLPPKQPVFAFLPLRSYGFRFVVQGDFDVPSSREDVDGDSSWNQWLRNEIPTAFLEALDTFKAHSDFSLMEAIINFLQFIPLEDEVLDFFKPVAYQIMQNIKAKPCLPVHVQPEQTGEEKMETDAKADDEKKSAKSKKETGLLWKLPSQMITCRDPLVKQLISPALLEKHLSLFYLHDEIIKWANPALLSALGVKRLKSPQILEVGKALAKEWEENFTPESVKQIAQWLVCLFRSIDEFDVSKTEMQMLQSLKIIPVMGNRLVCLQDSMVFFPSPQEGDKEMDQLTKMQGDLNILDDSLLNSVDQVGNSQVRRILEQAGVKQMTVRDIVMHHIIPVLKSEEWKTKNTATIDTYVMFLFHYTEKKDSTLNVLDLKSIIQVSTNMGVKNPQTDAIHFPPVYGNEVNLSITLPGYPWIMLAPQYLPTDASNQERWQLRQFFTKLGVLDFLSTKKVKHTFTAAELEKSSWASYKAGLDEHKGPFVIEDQVCEEFSTLIKNTSQKEHFTQMKELCHLMEKHHEQFTAKFLLTQICDEDGKTLKTDVKTSFGIEVTEAAWLPGKENSYSNVFGSIKFCENWKLYKGCDLYLRTPVIEKCLANLVAYLEANIPPDGNMVELLKICANLEIEDVRKFLLDWCSRSSPTDTEPKTFVTSLSHMSGLYHYLQDNMPRKMLVDLLTGHPCIFIPEKPSTEHTEVIVGNFLHAKEVCWIDPSGLFNKYHTGLVAKQNFQIPYTLSRLYAGLQELFTQSAQVQMWPELDCYIHLIEYITQVNVTPISVCDEILQVFEVIGKMVMGLPDNVKEAKGSILQAKFQKMRIIPTKENAWVSLSQTPMIPDSKTFVKMFSNQTGVYIVDIEDLEERNKAKKAQTLYNLDDVLAFLKLCNVPRFSECLEKSLVVEDVSECPRIQKYMHHCVPLLQTFLYNKHGKVYNSLVAAKVVNQLEEMTFSLAKKLEVVHKIKHLTSAKASSEPICLIDQGKAFYVTEKDVNSTSEILKVIANFFSQDDEAVSNSIRLFLADVLPTLDSEKPPLGQGFYSKFGFDRLPEEEKQWFVELPVEPEPEPEPELEPDEDNEPMNEDAPHEGDDDSQDPSAKNNDDDESDRTRAGDIHVELKDSSAPKGGKPPGLQCWPPLPGGDDDDEMPAPPEGYDERTPIPYSEQEVNMGNRNKRRRNDGRSDWRDKKQDRHRYKWRGFEQNYDNLPPDVFEVWGCRPPWYPDDLPWPPERPQWLDPNTSWPPPRPYNLDPNLPWPPPHWYDPDFGEEFPEWMDPRAKFPPPKREWVDQGQSERPKNWSMDEASNYWAKDKNKNKGQGRKDRQKRGNDDDDVRSPGREKVEDITFEEDGYEDSSDEEIIYYDEDGKMVKKLKKRRKKHDKGRNKRRKRDDGLEDVPFEEDGYEESEDEEIIDYDEQGRPIRKRRRRNKRRIQDSKQKGHDGPEGFKGQGRGDDYTVYYDQDGQPVWRGRNYQGEVEEFPLAEDEYEETEDYTTYYDKQGKPAWKGWKPNRPGRQRRGQKGDEPWMGAAAGEHGDGFDEFAVVYDPAGRPSWRGQTLEDENEPIESLFVDEEGADDFDTFCNKEGKPIWRGPKRGDGLGPWGAEPVPFEEQGLEESDDHTIFYNTEGKPVWRGQKKSPREEVTYYDDQGNPVGKGRKRDNRYQEGEGVPVEGFAGSSGRARDADAEDGYEEESDDETTYYDREGHPIWKGRRDNKSKPRAKKLRDISVKEGETAKVDISEDGNKWSSRGMPRNIRNFERMGNVSIADENVYESLGTGTPMLPDEIKLDTGGDQPDIGRFGEEVVRKYLQGVDDDFQFQKGCTIMETIWCNEGTESGNPYDFVVKLRDTKSNQIHKIYIEVKATMADEKEVFEVSGAEVKFAYDHGQNYHLYRLFNVCDPEKVRLKRIQYLSDKIEKKQVRLCMIV